MTEQLVFDATVVTSHHLYKKYSSDLDSLCQRDCGGKKYFNKEIKCLDMDSVERERHGITDCTMDAAVGIASYENNTTFLNDIKFKEDFPYAPLTDLPELKADFFNSFFPDINKAIGIFNFWMNVVDAFRNRNNHNEANAILQTINEVIRSIDCDEGSEIKIVTEMMTEETERKLKNNF